MDGVAVFQVDGGVGFGVGKDDFGLGLGVAGTLDKFKEHFGLVCTDLGSSAVAERAVRILRSRLSKDSWSMVFWRAAMALRYRPMEEMLERRYRLELVKGILEGGGIRQDDRVERVLPSDFHPNGLGEALGNKGEGV